MMSFVCVEEVENGFVLKNIDFEIKINRNGLVESLGITNVRHDIICNSSFVLNVSNVLSEPFISQFSSLVSFEFDTEFGEAKRVFTIKEKAFVLDDILVANKESQVDYKLGFCFKDFDYFMVGKNSFNIEEPISTNANDLLLVNEKQDIYFGCIFKETMELNFAKDKDQNIELVKKVSLGKSDMLIFSYTFSLV